LLPGGRPSQEWSNLTQEPTRLTPGIRRLSSGRYACPGAPGNPVIVELTGPVEGVESLNLLVGLFGIHLCTVVVVVGESPPSSPKNKKTKNQQTKNNKTKKTKKKNQKKNKKKKTTKKQKKKKKKKKNKNKQTNKKPKKQKQKKKNNQKNTKPLTTQKQKKIKTKKKKNTLKLQAQPIRRQLGANIFPLQVTLGSESYSHHTAPVLIYHWWRYLAPKLSGVN